MRDLRRYARQTNTRLLVGFIALLLLVGNGLIGLFFGREAALMGLLCSFAGLLPLLLIGLSLALIGWIVEKANRSG
jgi:hypothetical protein